MFQQISWATPAARSSCSSAGEPSLPCLLRGHTLPSRPSSWCCCFSDVFLSCLNLLNPQKTNLVPSPQIQAFLQLLSSMDSVKGPPIAKAAVREGTGPQQLGGGSRGGGDGKGEIESPLPALQQLRWIAHCCLHTDSEFAELQPN